jgi:hypothetical protein
LNFESNSIFEFEIWNKKIGNRKEETCCWAECSPAHLVPAHPPSAAGPKWPWPTHLHPALAHSCYTAMWALTLYFFSPTIDLAATLQLTPQRPAEPSGSRDDSPWNSGYIWGKGREEALARAHLTRTLDSSSTSVVNANTTTDSAQIRQGASRAWATMADGWERSRGKPAAVVNPMCIAAPRRCGCRGQLARTSPRGMPSPRAD